MLQQTKDSMYGLLVGIVVSMFGFSIVNAVMAQQNATLTVPTEELLSNTLTNWTAIIGSAISLILIILKWADSIISKRTDSKQKDKILEVSGKLQNSLKETDAWIKDTIIQHGDDIKTFISMIGKYPSVKEAVEAPEVNQFIQKLNARGIDAKTEFDRWYSFASHVTGLESKDPVVSKLAKIETELTPEGPEPDEELKVTIKTSEEPKPSSKKTA